MKSILRLSLLALVMTTLGGCPYIFGAWFSGSDNAPTYHPGHCQGTVVPCPDGRGSACCPACGGVCF